MNGLSILWLWSQQEMLENFYAHTSSEPNQQKTLEYWIFSFFESLSYCFLFLLLLNLLECQWTQMSSVCQLKNKSSIYILKSSPNIILQNLNSFKWPSKVYFLFFFHNRFICHYKRKRVFDISHYTPEHLSIDGQIVTK